MDLTLDDIINSSPKEPQEAPTSTPDMGFMDKTAVSFAEHLVRNPAILRKYAADKLGVPLEQVRLTEDGKAEIRTKAGWKRVAGYETPGLTELSDFATGTAATLPSGVGSGLGAGIGFVAGSPGGPVGSLAGAMAGGGAGGYYGGQAQDALARMMYGPGATEGSDRSGMMDVLSGAATAPLGMGASALMQRAARHGGTSLLRPLRPTEKLEDVMAKSMQRRPDAKSAIERMGIDAAQIEAVLPGWKPSFAELSPTARELMVNAGSKSAAAKGVLADQVGAMEGRLQRTLSDLPEALPFPKGQGGVLSRRSGVALPTELEGAVSAIPGGFQQRLKDALKSALRTGDVVTEKVPGITPEEAMQTVRATLSAGDAPDVVYGRLAAKGSKAVDAPLEFASQQLGQKFNLVEGLEASGQQVFQSLAKLRDEGMGGKPLVGEADALVKKLLDRFPRKEIGEGEAKSAVDVIASMNVGQLRALRQDISRLQREGLPKKIVADMKAIIDDETAAATAGVEPQVRKAYSSALTQSEQAAELLGVVGKGNPDEIKKFVRKATVEDLGNLRAVLPDDVVDNAIRARLVAQTEEATASPAKAAKVIRDATDPQGALATTMAPETFAQFQNTLADLTMKMHPSTITRDVPITGNLAAANVRKGVGRAIGFEPKSGNVEALREARNAMPPGDWDDFMNEFVTSTFASGVRSQDLLAKSAYWREALGPQRFKHVLSIAKGLEGVDRVMGSANKALTNDLNAPQKFPLGMRAAAGDLAYRVLSNVGRAQWLENLSYEKYAGDIARAALAPDGKKVLQRLKTFSTGQRASMAGLSNAILEMGADRLTTPRAQSAAAEATTDISLSDLGM